MTSLHTGRLTCPLFCSVGGFPCLLGQKLAAKPRETYEQKSVQVVEMGTLNSPQFILIKNHLVCLKLLVHFATDSQSSPFFEVG